ncbi:hypothetical protein M407DRAFT_20263 [Tulasnella calospora MUT 4182]|uniref:Uncharacterized protein n=1 Tax=Tulasnella calospora MUT 4182 TaxID=1051891 RepID=A0A0C3QS40_9AGAM|nr:hypothetical protein M407DRAFT_20263 [Tulasnella calospora MUT 4182]
MPSFITNFLFLASSLEFTVQSASIGKNRRALMACPLVMPPPSPNPFEAEEPTLAGYYLTTSTRGQAVLTKTEVWAAFISSPNGSLGLWGSAAPQPFQCSGFGFLNVVPPVLDSPQYFPLKWDNSALTTWNATVGSTLTKLGDPSSSSFVACKPDTSDVYSLFLQGTGTLPQTLTDTIETSFDVSKCIETRILVRAIDS